LHAKTLKTQLVSCRVYWLKWWE